MPDGQTQSCAAVIHCTSPGSKSPRWPTLYKFQVVGKTEQFHSLGSLPALSGSDRETVNALRRRKSELGPFSSVSPLR